MARAAVHCATGWQCSLVVVNCIVALLFCVCFAHAAAACSQGCRPHDPLRAIEDASKQGMMNAIDVQKPKIAKAFGHALNPARGSVTHVFDTMQGVGRLGIAGVAGVQGAVRGAGQGIRQEIYDWARADQGVRMDKRGFVNDAVQRVVHCGKECARGAGSEFRKAHKSKEEAERAGYEVDKAMREQNMHSAEDAMLRVKTARRQSLSHLTNVPQSALSRGVKAFFSPLPSSPSAPSLSSTRRRDVGGQRQFVWLVGRSLEENDESPFLRKRDPQAASEVGRAVGKALRSKSVGAIPRVALKAAEHAGGAASKVTPAARAAAKSAPMMSNDAKVSFAASAAAIGAAIASNIHISTPPISLHVQPRPNGRGRGFHTQLGEGGISGSLGSAQFHVPTSPRVYGGGGMY